jgi:hypothetical protein
MDLLNILIPAMATGPGDMSIYCRQGDLRA